MEIFRKLAEQRIKEALDNGEFDNLPNSGKPLKLDEDGFVPEELRVVYRVLKNAGYIPPELELRNEIISLRSLVNTIDDDEERLKKLRELNFRLLKFNEMRGRDLKLDDLPEYGSRIYDNVLK